MSDDIHSCSPYCDRPACVKEQRDKMRDAMAGDDVKMLEPVEVYVGIYAYTADQMREYADAKCAELRRRIAELEQSADLHYKSHAAAIAKLAESEKRVAELDADARRLDYLDSCNLPKRMGWDISKAPSGNVKVSSVIFLGSDPVTIRAAIDDAIGAEGGE